MANQPPESGNYPGTPRWVKAFGIVFLALVVLLVVMIVTGHGGPHAPLRHLRSGGATGQTPPASGAQRP